MKKLVLDSKFKRATVLSREQLRNTMGGLRSVGSGNPECLDQCQDAETDCNNGQVCQAVETPGCEAPYIPKRCVGVA